MARRAFGDDGPGLDGLNVEDKVRLAKLMRTRGSRSGAEVEGSQR